MADGKRGKSTREVDRAGRFMNNKWASTSPCYYPAVLSKSTAPLVPNVVVGIRLASYVPPTHTLKSSVFVSMYTLVFSGKYPELHHCRLFLSRILSSGFLSLARFYRLTGSLGSTCMILMSTSHVFCTCMILISTSRVFCTCIVCMELAAMQFSTPLRGFKRTNVCDCPRKCPQKNFICGLISIYLTLKTGWGSKGFGFSLPQVTSKRTGEIV